MNTIVVDAHAKINLSLDVVRKRPDGYHELKMIMQEIGLKDTLTITSLEDEKDKIEIISNDKRVPLDEKNIVWKAVELLKTTYDIRQSVRVHIYKSIPMSGGMGGGSTDAAAVLKGLTSLWNLDTDDETLEALSVKLGADVPFFIRGGTALAEGIGEVLTPLNPFKDRLVLVANPGISVSTRDVFESLNIERIKDRPDMNVVLDSIETGDTERLSRHMRNVLESVTLKTHPEILEIKETMKRCGALGSLMSGSGASVFGIFDSIEKLEDCKRVLEKDNNSVYETKTI